MIYPHNIIFISVSVLLYCLFIVSLPLNVCVVNSVVKGNMVSHRFLRREKCSLSLTDSHQTSVLSR